MRLTHPPAWQAGADTEQAIDGNATPLIVAAYKAGNTGQRESQTACQARPPAWKVHQKVHHVSFSVPCEHAESQGDVAVIELLCRMKAAMQRLA